MTPHPLTPHQAQYFAWLLTRRAASDSVESLASTLVDAEIDLNPHQVDAALFACRNPLSRGVKGEVTTGFRPFSLDVSQLRLQPGEREIVGQMLRTHEQFTLAAEIGLKDQRPEDYIVHALVDFDDIDYFTHADLLYDLAGQMVRHLQSYLSESEAVNVLNGQRKTIAKDPRSADGALLRGGDRV
ncbi:MAG TPA: hypothetical protein PKE41_10875 [Candidatus Macondimonas sp.]|nr:hypothetical protein [Candidatus Macondimonas sp.]